MSAAASGDEELVSRLLAGAAPAAMPPEVAARLQDAIAREAAARAEGDEDFEVEITQRTRAKQTLGTFGDNPLTRADAMGKHITPHVRHC